MAINKKFYHFDGNITSLSTIDLNLAIEANLSHTFQITIKDINKNKLDGYSFDKVICEKCKIAGIKSSQSCELFWYNSDICYLTCAEVIIKGIIE